MSSNSNSALSLPTLSSSIIRRYTLRPRNAAEHNARTWVYRLSTEVRTMIYGYIFDDARIAAVRDDWLEGDWAGPFIHRDSIVYVSRLTYTEARYQYYQSALYKIGYGHNITIPDRIRPLVTNVELGHIDVDDSFRFDIQAGLAAFPNLRTALIRESECLDDGTRHDFIANSSPESTLLSIYQERNHRWIIQAARALEREVSGLQTAIRVKLYYVNVRHACIIVSVSVAVQVLS